MHTETPQAAIELFAGAMNAGDLDAALSLYEPGATFAPQPGASVTGLPAIREALGGFLALRPALSGRVRKVLEADGVALVVNEWSLTGSGPDGGEISMSGVSSDVLRRRDDGRWLILVDDPWGARVP